MSDNNVLELRLVKVHCVDETNPEPVFSDDMRLSGVATDPGGNTFRLPVMDIGIRGGFDDGEWRTEPLTVATFDLSKGEGWPKGCVITLVLAEEDLGKLADFVNKLLDKSKEKVIEVLSAAAAEGVTAPLKLLLALGLNPINLDKDETLLTCLLTVLTLIENWKSSLHH